MREEDRWRRQWSCEEKREAKNLGKKIRVLILFIYFLELGGRFSPNILFPAGSNFENLNFVDNVR